MKSIINIKTNYSLLSSFISIDKLFSFAINNNIDVLGLNDNNMSAVITFYNKCLENNIKPIIGEEFLLDEKKISLYAKNYNGYKNLLKLTGIELTEEILNKYSNDLICVIPYESKDLFERLSTKYVDIYLGYKNETEKLDLLLIYNKVIFNGERRICSEKERDYLKYLYMIRDGKTISDNIEYENDYYSLEYENNQDDSTNDFISKIDIKFPTHYENLLPIYDTGKYSSIEYLNNLCRIGLNKRLNSNLTKEYVDRLEMELETINNMNFTNYFLVVYDYILWSKKNNILVGPGRGSAAGSLVAYTLGITDIDPVKYDLLFERFLNPERVTMPDIDTDFPSNDRNKVLEYVKEKYGELRVANIITFDTLLAKASIRDVGRVYNIPSYKIDNLSKTIPKILKKEENSIKYLYKNVDSFRKEVDNDSSLKNVIKIASLIEGFPRNTGIHASGIIMSKTDLNEIVPLIRNDRLNIVGFEAPLLEDLGLLKMDFLGIDNLTIVDDIIKEINKSENNKITFNSIPLDDKDTLEMFSKGMTTGIFQFESEGMKNFLKRLKPSTFDDIIAAIALYRPGPSNNIDTYIRRKEGKEEIVYLDDRLKRILKSTYGILIYQEQIMQIAQIVADFSLGEADILRKAMSKKKVEILKELEPKFINNGLKNGYKNAKEIYDLILEFANYGFNKSHSVSYSVVSFKMLYLKCHYREIFYSKLLTNSSRSDKMLMYINEIKALNIKIKTPNIKISKVEFTGINNEIIYGLSGILNIGLDIVKNIVNERDEKMYTDIYDFLSRVGKYSITEKDLINLNHSGSLLCFGYNIRTIDNNMNELINYMQLTKDLGSELIEKPEIEQFEEYEDSEMLKFNQEVFGIPYLNNHPTSKYIRNDNNIILLKDCKNYFNKFINTIVYIENIKEISTKSGDKMAFVEGSDETDKMSYTIFPDTYNKISKLKKGSVYKIYGNVEKRYDKYQIVVKNIVNLM